MAVAQPRFIRRPSAKIKTDRLVSCELPLIVLGLDVASFDLASIGQFLDPAMSISLSKWPMLQTMALSFILAMCATVMTIFVTGSGNENVAGIDHVLDGLDFVAFHDACNAQIGSISVTITRQP